MTACPARRLAQPRRRIDRRLVATRLVRGLSAREVARLEGVEEESIAAILGEKEFDRLVAHYRDLLALPPDERYRQLVELAWEVLQFHLELGDAQVAMFVLRESVRGRRAPESLADAVERFFVRAHGLRPPPPREAEPPPDPPSSREAAPPGAGNLGGTVRALRDELMERAAAEAGLRRLGHIAEPAATPDETPAVPAPATGTIAKPALAHARRLLGGTAGPLGGDPERHAAPENLLRDWVRMALGP